MNERRPRAIGFGVAVSLLALTTLKAGMADPQPRRETPVPTPGRSIASNDEGSATSTNPANLGFLVSSEARWMWVKTGEGSPMPGRGHAFDLALSLPANIGTGLRLDFVRPNELAFPLSSPFALPTSPIGP